MVTRPSKTFLKFGRGYRNASEPKIELWNTKESTVGINTSLNFVQDKAIGFNSEEFEGNAENEMDTNTWCCNLSAADRIESHKKRDKSDLGTCFMIEQNGINWVYILYDKKFFRINLRDCYGNLQIQLIKSMRSGRVTPKIKKLWSASDVPAERIEEKSFIHAKQHGIKPSEPWCAEEIRNLQTQGNNDYSKVIVSPSDRHVSDKHSFPSGGNRHYYPNENDDQHDSEKDSYHHSSDNRQHYHNRNTGYNNSTHRPREDGKEDKDTNHLNNDSFRRPKRYPDKDSDDDYQDERSESQEYQARRRNHNQDYYERRGYYRSYPDRTSRDDDHKKGLYTQEIPTRRKSRDSSYTRPQESVQDFDHH